MPSIPTALRLLESALADAEAARAELPAHAFNAAGVGATEAVREAITRLVEAARYTKAWVEEQEAEP